MAAEPLVTIVDDDPAARDSVAALVKSKGLGARMFASAEEFLAALDPAESGCLVVDVRMTGMSGVELQEALRARGVGWPVIVITGYGDVPTAVRAMKAGALTFLEKPCRTAELWSAIQDALANSAEQSSQRERLSEIQARFDQLSADERQVLRLMLSGATNKTIATQLDLGLRTVELRRANLMKKMQARSLADLIRLVLAVEESGE